MSITEQAATELPTSPLIARIHHKTMVDQLWLLFMLLFEDGWKRTAGNELTSRHGTRFTHGWVGGRWELCSITDSGAHRVTLTDHEQVPTVVQLERFARSGVSWK